MAHNLATNVNTGKASFFTVREQAWHRLGVVLDQCPTSKQAIAYAGLDYEVEKVPLLANTAECRTALPTDDEQGSTLNHYPQALVKNYFATVRKDNLSVLGVVGRNYYVVQNSKAFGFFDSIVGKGAAIYETAGALGKGEVMFISAKLPESIVVKANGREDVVDKYLLLTNSHDGSSAIRILFTPVRVVCNNTLNIALHRGQGQGISLRHTLNVHDELSRAGRLLGIVQKEYDVAQESYQHLASIKINDKQLRHYIDKVFPHLYEQEEVSTRLVNIRKKVFEYTMEGAGQQDIQGTAWWAYNGVTGYFQNVRHFGGGYEQLLKTNVLGSGQMAMRNALKEALALA